MSEPCQVCMALGTNGIDLPCSVCDQPDLTPVELARQSLASPVADVNVLATAVLAQDELRRMATSCPCHHTTPCSNMCSCAHPPMSAGCRRCALYGSKEQRQGAARRLAAQDEDLAKLRAALKIARKALERIVDEGGASNMMSRAVDALDRLDADEADELRRLANGE